MFDYSEMKKILSNNEQNDLSHRTCPIASSIQGKHRVAIRSQHRIILVLKELECAGMNIFEALKSHFDDHYVSILNNIHKIWTIYSNLTSENIPIVLIHGFDIGIGLWSLNLDQLCSSRPVYVIDLLGLARSSRPIFSLDPIEAEKQFIDMLEE
ncbi:unnamed protein product [Rotaria sordida]|uniref:Uncharacterized protein n=3 Tax=Rotaria sordida TaxID=392033 RepID=A0A819I2K7_9BILA|nr:unnamed protein product [Rotaria sordida]